MAFFRPVQAVGRPTSYTIASGDTLYRGQIVFLKSDGTVTITGTSNCVVAGIADDNKASSIYDIKIQQYVLTATGTQFEGGQTITTGYTQKAALSDVYATATITKSGWLVEYKLTTDSTYTKFTASQVTVDVAVEGVITVTVDNGILTDGSSYNVRVTAVMEVLKNATGYTSVSDQFSNDSTAASGLATVWFMPGEYESDMYDNTVSYGVGDLLYVTTAGIITSAGSASAFGASESPIGYVVGAPSASLTAQTRVTNGHANPNPQALRFYFTVPVDAI